MWGGSVFDLVITFQRSTPIPPPITTITTNNNSSNNNNKHKTANKLTLSIPRPLSASLSPIQRSSPPRQRRPLSTPSATCRCPGPLSGKASGARTKPSSRPLEPPHNWRSTPAAARMDARMNGIYEAESWGEGTGREWRQHAASGREKGYISVVPIPLSPP